MRRVMIAGWALVAAVAIILMAAFAPAVKNARAASPKTPWRNLTPAQLSALWWQWALSIPVSDNPLFDDTGRDAFNGQPYSDLVFLCGTIAITLPGTENQLGEATRSIRVRKGTAFFFPLVNSEWDNVGFRTNLGGNFLELDRFPQVKSIPELRALAAASVEGATDQDATVTPTDATFQTATGPTLHLDHPRSQSPPFSYKLPANDNIDQYFGVEVSGTVAPVVADGFYTFIPGTLKPGYYVMHFEGVIPLDDEGHTLTQDITYQITVTN